MVKSLNYLDKLVSKRLGVPPSQIAQVCQQWKITELAVFGSALREDFNPESDLDLLVTFAPDAQVTLFDLEAIEQQLKALCGREVDVVSKRAIERSHNWIRRQNILEQAQVMYVAG